MQKNILISIVGILLGAVVISSSAVVWEEDFEGALLGASSSDNSSLAGTSVASKNVLGLEVVAAPAAFTSGSGQVIKISAVGNAFAAIVPAAKLEFATVQLDTPYTLAFDLYIPSTLAAAVGDFQPRFTDDGTGASGSTDSSAATLSAGVHRIEYTGLVGDLSAGITQANEAFPFIGFDQGSAMAANIAYMDNLFFEFNMQPALDAVYFSALKNQEVESTALVQWQHFGPGMSGYIDKFWINNGDPNAMYDELDMGNGHVTLNRGEFWRSYKESDGNGLPSGIKGIEFSYQDPDFGLMLAKEGIYSSSDRGVSWDFVLDIDPSNSQMHSVLTVDPRNDNRWYIGAGRHWMIKESHFTKSGIEYTSSGNYSSGFILKSIDKGQSWDRITSVFAADSDFSKVIVDPRDGDIVYASNQHGVYKSVDAGLSWGLVSGHAQLPHNQPRDMGFYYDGADEFLLYVLEVTHYATNGNEVVTTGGVYRSADGGDNWDNLTGDLGIDLTQISQGAYHDKFYRAVAFWQQTDAATIQNGYNLPTNTFSQFTRMAVDPTNKDRIYLSHNYKHDYAFPPGNIWMTENGGTNWCAAAREGTYWRNGTDASYWHTRVTQPLGANVKMAHVHREHYENDNTQSGPRFVFCNTLGEAYTCFAQQMMRSTDHGATWNQIDDEETAAGSGHWVGRGNSNLPGETFCLDARTPNTYLWGSGEHGLWRNTNDGDSVYPGALAVEQLVGQSIANDDPTSVSVIAVHPSDTNQIYTLHFRQDKRGDLRYSGDAGASWSTISTPVAFPGSDQSHIDQRSLLIDYNNPDTMYFCIPRSEWERWSSTFRFNGPDNWTGHGIFKSTDGGRSTAGWTLVTNGIPTGSSVYRMAMDIADPNILYAALNYSHDNVTGGLYKTTDGGDSWNTLTLPAGIDSVNNVAVSPVNGWLYIACGRSGASTGGGYVSEDAGVTWTLLFDMPYLRHFVPSAIDANIIAVNVDKAGSVGNRNPGAYVTIDGGASWTKINNRHGQPDGIRKIEPDPVDPDTLWMGTHGTGFFRADISALRTGIKKPVFWDWMAEKGQMNRLADTDKDGQDTRMEFLAGTDPADGDSRFQVELSAATATGCTLSFDTQLNRLYSVDTADDLSSGEWTKWITGISGVDGVLEVDDAAIHSNRFYRIRLELD